MKYTILISLLFIQIVLSAQIDYCIEINKAIKAAANNFIDYNNFQFYTTGGQKAYLTDFSFVPGKPGYIYKDSAKNENVFYQQLSNTNSDYSQIYKSIEKCLANASDKWQKTDGAGNSSVIFSSDKTGGEIMLISGSTGVALQITRDKQKGIDVIAADFCTQLIALANACNNDFAGYLGTRQDSSVLGIRYKSVIKLNQRNLVPGSISLAKDIFDKTKRDNRYTEIFDGDDIEYNSLLSIVEECLSQNNGWQKTESTYTEGINFTKGDVQISISKNKPSPANENPDSYISISSYSGF